MLAGQISEIAIEGRPVRWSVVLLRLWFGDLQFNYAVSSGHYPFYRNEQNFVSCALCTRYCACRNVEGSASAGFSIGHLSCHARGITYTTLFCSHLSKSALSPGLHLGICGYFLRFHIGGCISSRYFWRLFWIRHRSCWLGGVLLVYLLSKGVKYSVRPILHSGQLL